MQHRVLFQLVSVLFVDLLLNMPAYKLEIPNFMLHLLYYMPSNFSSLSILGNKLSIWIKILLIILL